MGDMADWMLEQSECIYYGEDFCPEKAKVYGPGPCPKCGKETRLLDGKYGQFHGCQDFPKCNGSRYFVSRGVSDLVLPEDTVAFICDKLGCYSHITLVRDVDNKLVSCGPDLVKYCPFCGKKYKEAKK